RARPYRFAFRHGGLAGRDRRRPRPRRTRTGPQRARHRRTERRRRHHRGIRGGRGMTTMAVSLDPRTQFARTVTDLLAEDLSTALVYAEISARFFSRAERDFPERVVNVGIREQLMVNVGAGMALTGMRPVVHS